MKIATPAQVKNRFSAYIVESQKSPVIITENGRPVALLTGISEEDIDTLELAHNPRLVQILEEAREDIRRTGGIPHKEFWAQVKKRRARKKST